MIPVHRDCQDAGNPLPYIPNNKAETKQPGNIAILSRNRCHDVAQGETAM